MHVVSVTLKIWWITCLSVCFMVHFAISKIVCPPGQALIEGVGCGSCLEKQFYDQELLRCINCTTNHWNPPGNILPHCGFYNVSGIIKEPDLPSETEDVNPTIKNNEVTVTYSSVVNISLEPQNTLNPVKSLTVKNPDNRTRTPEPPMNQTEASDQTAPPFEDKNAIEVNGNGLSPVYIFLIVVIAMVFLGLLIWLGVKLRKAIWAGSKPTEPPEVPVIYTSVPTNMQAGNNDEE